MPTILRVTWTVAPATSPRIWRNCPGCRAAMPFHSTGAFRTNAQKKRIDIWLVYRCTACGARWNLPIFERVMVGDLPSGLFDAIARNDPATARAYAGDIDRLARHSHRVEEIRALALDRRQEKRCRVDATTLEIRLIVRAPVATRLDQVLADQFGLPRSRVRALYESAVVSLHPPRRRGLRAGISDGQTIHVDLSRMEAEARDALLSAACA